MLAMRMRTKLLLALLSVSFSLAAACLFVVRTTLTRQIHARLLGDLNASVNTFRNLQTQRRQMLSHDTALLADLPTLKALMSSADPDTIRDAGARFWKVSGSDFLALANPNGETIAIYNDGKPLQGSAANQALRQALDSPQDPQYVNIDGRLYEVSIEPLYFGPPPSQTSLGYVISGYEVNDQVAREVSQAAAAEVAFFVDGKIVSSTLDPSHKAKLLQAPAALAARGGKDISLAGEHFLVASVPLSTGNSPKVQLLVLKSYDQASVVLRRLNGIIAILGAFVLVAGGLLALYLAGTITRPLESLASQAIAFGSGEFHRELRHKGAREIHDLSRAFDRMRSHLRQTQEELLEAERLATIGRMASSISHDLRHHLSTIYANAEFLECATLESRDRGELLGDVRLAVREMTELIESLLMFSRTGKTLHLTLASTQVVAERSAALAKAHPAAAGVRISTQLDSQSEIWIDVTKVERAIYNVLLNACQAAGLSEHAPSVAISLSEDADWLRFRIKDNGRGVADSIRLTLFEPFVSEGKQNGTGLGLTLAHRIAQEHGGSVVMEESGPEGTVFILSFSKKLETSPTAPESAFTAVRATPK